MYKSTKTIPIYNFYRIIETSDLKYLYKEFDDESENDTLIRKTPREESEIFEDIFYEYCEITSNHNLRIKTRKQFLIEEWSIIYSLIADILSRYKAHGITEVLELLADIDPIYAIDLEKDIDVQVKKIERKMIGLKNKILIYKSKFVNSDNNKKNKENEEEFDLEIEAINIELGLELNRPILVKETTVSYYFKLKKILLKKQKSYGEN